MSDLEIRALQRAVAEDPTDRRAVCLGYLATILRTAFLLERERGIALAKPAEKIRKLA